MNEPRGRRRPSVPGLIAGGLVGAGILLWMFVSRGFLFVAGLGAFGPGILRELGWLRDHDEFQREGAHRAGYHAYLVGGLAAVIVLAIVDWQGTTAEDATEWIRFIVFVLWLTWLFSALLAYWGPERTTALLLRTVGAFWAVFVVADILGSAAMPRNAHDVWTGLLGLGAAILFVAPFFVLGWTVHRWPRRTGIALLVMAAVLLAVLGGRRNFQWSTYVMTRTLMVGPMIATGIALLRNAAGSPELAEGAETQG